MQRALVILALGVVVSVPLRARADELAEEFVQEESPTTQAAAPPANETTTNETSTSETSTSEPTASEPANEVATTSLPPVDASSATTDTPPTEAEEEDARIAAGLAERRRLRPWHILFGNLTWAASNVATIFGFIAFSDRYGFDGSPASTGCARSSAIFGDTCPAGSLPLAHVVSITALTLLYGSVFTIGAVMPDPLGAGEGPSAHSQEINVHRALRWTSLAIMALQIVLGAISQNVEFNDFGADRAMAATHLALGTVSWGVITAQGIVGSLLAY
jgi:hypothetical protein